MWWADHTTKLSDEQRLHFYEVLAHSLTVVVRGIWSNPAIGDAAKVERMKWVNELLHRVTAKVYTLRLKTHEWSEEDFAEIIENSMHPDKGIGPGVEWAIRHSYRVITDAEMTPRP